MSQQEKFEAAFSDLLAHDAELALQLITGMFVGLTIEYSRRRGYETDCNIIIHGGADQRAITIHKAGE